MDTIFMSSENSKTSGSYRLLLNFEDNILLFFDCILINMLLYQILACTTLGKI